LPELVGDVLSAPKERLLAASPVISTSEDPREAPRATHPSGIHIRILFEMN
jgi:hypothetical protein